MMPNKMELAHENIKIEVDLLTNFFLIKEGRHNIFIYSKFFNSAVS
jgi:hypothetical protein